MKLRTEVEADAYGLIARVVPDEETEYRSDRMAVAFQVADRARALGIDPEVREVDGEFFLFAFLGDLVDDLRLDWALGAMKAAATW